MTKTKNKTSEKEALAKLMSYCAKQDRCHKEVRTKLIKLEVYGDALESIISELISMNFLNEERFAKSYVRGKFRIKKWGKIKILNELRKRQISSLNIKRGMTEIDELEYIETLRRHVIKKKPLVEKLTYTDKARIARYCVQKGFESDLVWEQINGI